MNYYENETKKEDAKQDVDRAEKKPDRSHRLGNGKQIRLCNGEIFFIDEVLFSIHQ